MGKTTFEVDITGREHLEEWRSIPGWFGYEASNLGRIRSPRKVLAQHITRNGYLITILSRGKAKTVSVHKHILLAFRGPAPEGHECRHLNSIRTDNRIENLAWGTHSENAQDQVRHGTHRNISKTHCIRGHEFTPENTYSRGKNQRTCMTCKRLMENRGYHRRRAQGLPR